MYVLTGIAIVSAAAMGVSGGEATMERWNLPHKVAEHEASNKVVRDTVRAMALKQIHDMCKEDYPDVSKCPAWKAVVDPNRFNILGKEVAPTPKVGSNG